MKINKEKLLKYIENNLDEKALKQDVSFCENDRYSRHFDVGYEYGRAIAFAEIKYVTTGELTKGSFVVGSTRKTEIDKQICDEEL